MDSFPNDFPTISIILPCLNEAETLAECLSDIQRVLQNANLNGEIIVADNGSTDGSLEIAKQAGVKIVHIAKKGYGSALKGGLTQAQYPFLVMGDSDGSADWKQIPVFMGRLNSGFDVVIGCRFEKGGGRIEKGAMSWLNRYVGNPFLSGLGRFLFHSPIVDFHCGMRALTKKAFEQLQLQTDGMEFASEMVAKAELMKIKMTQIPITQFIAGRSRPPHLRRWRDGLRHIVCLFKLRFGL
jgi:glycosyltransferase involved in cell wall biosynthesis